MASPKFDLSDLGAKKIDLSDLGAKRLDSEQQQDATPSALERYGSGVYRTTIQPLKDIKKIQEENVKKYGEFAAGFKTMYDIAKGMVVSSNDQAVTALKALKDLDFGEFIQHIPGAVPMFGPAAVQASETMEKGDISGGFGEATGLIGGAVAGAKAPAVIKATPRVVSQGLNRTARSMYQSALKPSPSGLSPNEVQAINQAGLDLNVGVGGGQLNKLYSLIEDYNNARGGFVDNAPAPRADVSVKVQPKQLTAGAREMPPVPPDPGTTQTVLADPVLETTFTNQSQRVPAGLLTPGGTAGSGAGKFVTSVEKGKLQPLPVVTRPNILPGMTAEEVIAQGNKSRGFVSADSRPMITETYEGPYKPPTKSTTVTGKEAATAENTYPEQITTKLESAKNQQLIDAINERAQNSGLLAAMQESAMAANQKIPLRFSDVYDVKLSNVIYPKDIAKRIDGIIEKFRTVNPEANLDALAAAKAEFLRNYPDPLSLKQAQKLKSNTYREIGSRNYADNTKKTSATVAAEKALARGLMEEIGEQIPEVKPINAMESKALSLLPELEKAVNRIGNWEMFSPGLYGATAGIAGGVLGGTEIGVSLGAMVTILRNPYFKSKLAIAINKASMKGKTPISVSKAYKIIESHIDRMSRTAAAINISQSKQQKQQPAQ